MSQIQAVCQLKAINPKWGPKRVTEEITMGERKVKKVCEPYFSMKTIAPKSQDNCVPTEDASTERNCI